MKHLLLALAAAASLTACSSEPTAFGTGKDVLMHNDFESLMGWIPDPVALTKVQAHSGQYSVKVDKDHEYSMGFTSLLGQLSASRIRGVKIEAWAFTADKNPSAQLRLAINGTAGGTPIMTEGIEYATQVKEPAKWVKVSKEFTFPPAANYSSQVVVYLWRGGTPNTAYVDDIVVTALP